MAKFLISDSIKLGERARVDPRSKLGSASESEMLRPGGSTDMREARDATAEGTCTTVETGSVVSTCTYASRKSAVGVTYASNGCSRDVVGSLREVGEVGGLPRDGSTGCASGGGEEVRDRREGASGMVGVVGGDDITCAVQRLVERLKNSLIKKKNYGSRRNRRNEP